MSICSNEKLIVARLQSTNGGAIPTSLRVSRFQPELEVVRELRRNTFLARHYCREGIHRQGTNPRDVRFSLLIFFYPICVPRMSFRVPHDSRLGDSEKRLSYRERFFPSCGLAV